MFPVLTHGATYYVANTGSDSNSCSSAQLQSTPKLTINAGVSCLNGGDTLIIKAGTYVGNLSGSIPSGSSGAPTTIRAEVARGAVIQLSSGHTLGLDLSGRSYIVIDGLVFDGNNSNRGYAIRIGAGVTNLTLQNIEIKNILSNNNADNAGGISFGYIDTNPNIIVKNSSIHDIGNDDTSDRCSSCFSYGTYSSTNGTTFDGNEFYNISGYAMHMYDSGHGSMNSNIIRNNYFRNTGTVLIACTGTGNQVYNNILDRVGTTVSPYNHQGIRACGNNNTFYNNTIVGSGGDCVALEGSGNTARNNICWQNGNDAITGQGNTLSNNLLGQDPLFVNAAGGDFHLQNGSPAIDAGIVISNLSYKGSAPDLGALESGAGGQLPAPTKLRLVGN
jgi:hypothetical protein